MLEVDFNDASMLPALDEQDQVNMYVRNTTGVSVIVHFYIPTRNTY